MPGPVLRPYEPADLDALYEICHRTGVAGEDASSLVSDRRLLGTLFAAPYAVLEPDLVTVAEVDGEVGGYIVGTADTARFHERMDIEWLPACRAERPEGSGGDGLDSLFVALLHHPVRAEPALLATHPAHLHIDLLPHLQGRGLGRRMMEGFCTAVAARGAAGVHFGVNPANVKALAFYRHLGFEELSSNRAEVTMGRRLQPS